jgi:hypothetical protein
MEFTDISTNLINVVHSSSYTESKKNAIKKYRQSEKGAIKNRELSKKYYEERKDKPEIKEKVKEAHKSNYSRLKEDSERYKAYLERKKELYHLRKEEQKKMEEINEEIKQKQKEKYPNIEELNPNISTELTPEQKKEQVKMRRKGLKLLNEII